MYAHILYKHKSTFMITYAYNLFQPTSLVDLPDVYNMKNYSCFILFWSI